MTASLLSFPAPLAPFASQAAETRGRLHKDPESKTRTPFQRDRDRVVHSVAFRRLKHKTQVFVYHEGDHYRTRLTHSLEVAQIARSLARMLKVDEDLAECVALAHDLGHPPFGHTGEDVLQECMSNYKGFDHNAQTLRILTKLETRHAGFDGLNLTWESLEGVVKHNGPLIGPLADEIHIARKKTAAPPLPAALVEYAATHDLLLDTYPALEAQIAALADDIAYNNHDADDGLKAGLFTLEEAMDVPLVGEWIAKIRSHYPNIDESRLICEAVSGMIGDMVMDVFHETTCRLKDLKPETAQDIRMAKMPMVAFSPDMDIKVQALRKFLWEKMYRHFEVNRARSHAKRIVRDLFDVFLNEPETLPPVWRARFENAKEESAAEDKKTRAICDYIAGMTDRYAIREHRKLFDSEKWL